MLTLKMPQLALGSDDVTVGEWLVVVGDSFTAGTPLLTIETDKATMDVEAPFDGTVAEMLCAPGEVVGVGHPILHARGPGEAPDSPLAGEDEAGDEAVPAQADVRTPARSAQPAAPAASAEAPPAVRPPQLVPLTSPSSLSAPPLVTVEYGELAGLPRRGEARVAPAATPTAATSLPDDPSLSGRFTERRLSRPRIAIGRRLATHIPAFSIVREVDVAPALERVQRARSAGHGVTLTDVLLEACAAAARGVPQANAWLLDGAIREFEEVGVALAIDTPGGVIAPVVRGAESRDVLEIAEVRRDLVERTRAGTIQPPELTGATITLSNVGGLQAHAVVPVITLPQVAALGVGAAKADGSLTCTFVGDHRALDGGDGARFLTLFDAAFTRTES